MIVAEKIMMQPGQGAQRTVIMAGIAVGVLYCLENSGLNGPVSSIPTPAAKELKYVKIVH